MEYLTTAEQAEIWKISQRRVAILCKAESTVLFLKEKHG